MEGSDAVVITIDEAEIIHVLQQHVAGIVEDLRARVMVDEGQESLEGGAVVQVLAGMELETQLDAGTVRLVEQWAPAPRQFVEGACDQPRGVWRIRIKERPRQAARERHDPRHAQRVGPRDGAAQIPLRLALARLRIATDCRRRQRIHHLVISGMNGQKLPGAVRGNFADRETRAGDNGLDRSDGLGLGQRCQVGQACVGHRNLQCLEVQSSRPLCKATERIERSLRSDELADEQSRAENSFWLHAAALTVVIAHYSARRCPFNF